MEWQFNATVILFLLSVGSLFGLLIGYLWGNLERHNRAQLRQEQAQVEQRISEPLTLSPKVIREIIDILDGDDYEWAWRDAI